MRRRRDEPRDLDGDDLAGFRRDACLGSEYAADALDKRACVRRCERQERDRQRVDIGKRRFGSFSRQCTGPAVAIAPSGPWGWTFDPTEEMQTFAGSILTQEVALTVSGSGVTTARVDGMAANLGEPTAQRFRVPVVPAARAAATASSGRWRTHIESGRRSRSASSDRLIQLVADPQRDPMAWSAGFSGAHARSIGHPGRFAGFYGSPDDTTGRLLMSIGLPSHEAHAQVRHLALELVWPNRVEVLGLGQSTGGPTGG